MEENKVVEEVVTDNAGNENVVNEDTTKAEIDKLTSELTKLKKLLSSANSESANYKRQLREKLSNEEKEKADAQEERERLEAELNSLKKEKRISEFKANLIGMSFNDEDALSTASAMVDGDFDTVFANFKSLIDSISKQAKVSAMDKSGNLSVGEPVGSDSIETAKEKRFRKAMGLE